MVLAFTEQEDVSLNVGFYYMANAAGRLVGTILSGSVFMLGRTDMAGMQLCLWVSSCLVLLSWLSSLGIPSFNRLRLVSRATCAQFLPVVPQTAVSRSLMES